MLDFLMDNRIYLQSITLVIATACLASTILMMYFRVLPWRYMVIPVLVLLQIIVFYLYVLLAHPIPSVPVTFVSAVLRLEMVVAFFTLLLLYWSERWNHQ